MIYDRYNRPLTSMRISITQRCNFNCIYCHKEGVTGPSKEEMTPGEISRIVALTRDYGVKKVKITGGEPLIRKDVCDIVEGISRIDGIKDVSMTTNGSFLSEYARDLKNAGLNRINVSLDTLNKDLFSKITRGGNLEQVVPGIESAVNVGLKPVKLNMVVMKGLNDGEVEGIMKRYSREGIVLQLIELVENDSNLFDRYFYDLDDFEKRLESEAEEVVIRRYMQGRRKYMLNGSEVEIVKPMHNSEFCAMCTRIRVTADGKFKPCLMRNDNMVDFLSPMRSGASDNELKELFKEAINRREPYFKSKDSPRHAPADTGCR